MREQAGLWLMPARACAQDALVRDTALGALLRVYADRANLAALHGFTQRFQERCACVAPPAGSRGIPLCPLSGAELLRRARSCAMSRASPCSCGTSTCMQPVCHQLAAAPGALGFSPAACALWRRCSQSAG